MDKLATDFLALSRPHKEDSQSLVDIENIMAGTLPFDEYDEIL
jgi:hypothetical protein